jgi:hypothetical protein
MAIRRLKNGTITYSGKDAMEELRKFKEERIPSWDKFMLLDFEFKNSKQK